MAAELLEQVGGDSALLQETLAFGGKVFHQPHNVDRLAAFWRARIDLVLSGGRLRPPLMLGAGATGAQANQADYRRQAFQ